jgi:hypothetical protein
MSKAEKTIVFRRKLYRHATSIILHKYILAELAKKSTSDNYRSIAQELGLGEGQGLAQFLGDISDVCEQMGCCHHNLLAHSKSSHLPGSYVLEELKMTPEEISRERRRIYHEAAHTRYEFV